MPCSADGKRSSIATILATRLVAAHFEICSAGKAIAMHVRCEPERCGTSLKVSRDDSVGLEASMILAGIPSHAGAQKV